MVEAREELETQRRNSDGVRGAAPSQTEGPSFVALAIAKNRFAQRGAGNTDAGATRIVPVHVVSREVELEPERVFEQHVDIVVDTRNTVRVLPGFDDTTLRRVLDVLREKAAR